MKTSRASTTLLAAMLAVASLTAPARVEAQSARDIAAAKQAFREGEDAEGKGDYQAALDRFRAALAIKETPQLHLRIGAVLERLGKLTDALAAYRMGLDKANGQPAVAKVAEEQIGALRPRIPTITLVAPNITGLTVSLDDKAVPASSLGAPMMVNPGLHRVHAEAPGREPRDQTVTTVERAALRIELDLARVAAAAPVEAPSKVPGALTAAAGGAALIAGAALIGLSVDKDHRIDALCGGAARDHCPLSKKPQIDADVRTVNAMRFSGFGVLAAGLAGASVGTWLLVKATSSSVEAAPVVGPGNAGVVVKGRF